MSVLTDTRFFQGNNADLQAVKQTVDLPVLRKDFIIDPYQIYESLQLGADCILLIAAILTDKALTQLFELAKELGLAVLIEVHTLAELKRVLPLKPELIGINNRDLHSFKTSLDTTLTLAQHVEDNTIIVSESGIHSSQDLKTLMTAGIYSFLIGEGFMKTSDPGRALSDLLR